MSDATLTRSFPVARRSYHCDGCERPILKGTRYHYWTGTASDVRPGILTYRECAGCYDRYGRYQHLSPENRAKADAWMTELGLPVGQGVPNVA